MIIKKVFRELNRLCLDRGVFFTYVDLRWGITEKQTKSGRTIEICLREVSFRKKETSQGRIQDFHGGGGVISPI